MGIGNGSLKTPLPLVKKAIGIADGRSMETGFISLPVTTQNRTLNPHAIYFLCWTHSADRVLIYFYALNHSLSQQLDQLALQQQARLEKAVERLRILRQEIYEQQLPFGQTLGRPSKRGSILERSIKRRKKFNR